MPAENTNLPNSVLPAGGTLLPTVAEVNPVVPRPRGRPRGSGRKGGNGAAANRGRGHGIAKLENFPIEGDQPQTQEIDTVPLGTAENAADTIGRPRRALGKYEAGEAIVDTIPHRRSEEVNLAKKLAQEKAENTRVANEQKVQELRRQLALLEDDLQREDMESIARTRRPDLVDRQLEIPKVSAKTIEMTVSDSKDVDELEHAHLSDEIATDQYQSASVADKQKMLDALLTSSDGEDPPMGIIDDGSSGVFWSGPLVKEVKEQHDKCDNTSLGAHDGENVMVAKPIQQPSGLKAALTAVAPKGKQPVPAHGDLRRDVGLLRAVPAPNAGGQMNPTNIKRKDAPVEVAQTPVSVVPSAKRPKNEAPSGLITGWRLKVQKSLTNTVQEEAEDPETANGVTGEFDVEDTPQALAVARAAKQNGIKMKTPTNNVLIQERPVMLVDSSTKRLRREKPVVAQLPLLTASPEHLQRWQKQFRHMLIEWAASQPDPFGTNGMLTNRIVTNIWDNVYPDVYIGGIDNDRERNLAILISLCSDILLDWRSSIGSTALTVLQDFFEENGFSSQDIIEYVEWAYVPSENSFNFIYANPEAATGGKGGMKSPHILNLLTVHTKKTTLSVIQYGNPIGALALCVTALECAFKLWASGVNPSPKKGAAIVPGSTKRTVKEAFNDERWGGRARKWVKTAERLTAADWDHILGYVNSAVLGGDHDAAAGAGGEDMQHNEDGLEDARAFIEL